MKLKKVTKQEATILRNFAYEKRMLRSCLTDLAKEEDEYWKIIKTRYNLPKDTQMVVNNITGKVTMPSKEKKK